MRKFSYRLCFKFAFAFLLVANPVYSQSQSDLERSTREVDILGKEEKGIEEKLRPAPEKAPEITKEEPAPRKEEQKFFVKKIKLLGCETFPPEDFSSITAKCENKETALTELDACAREIEKEYLKKGIIAAVFLPPQDIKEQTVILQVVEAKMGKLESQEHKYFKNKRLAYYWKIKPDETLEYGKILKSLQIMNKNPDRQVKSALKAGKKPGTTDIVLSTKTRLPLHIGYTYDREGIPTTGKSRNGVSIRHNNFLGFDDILLTGYTFGQDFDGSYVYHNIPISPNGTYLLYGYSISGAKPKKEFASSGVKSEAVNSNWSVHQDMYNKNGDYLGEVFFGFDAKDKVLKTNTAISNRDRLRILSMGGSYFKRGLESTTTISPEISQGLDVFGASTNGNPLASRGAKSKFTRINLGVSHRRALPLGMQANLKFSGQAASVKLMPQEEFSLGGIDSVRGYPSGDYLADNAALNNAELLIPSFYIPSGWRLPYAPESFKDEVTTVVFLDYGWGQRKGALPTENRTVNFLGAGAGFRVKLFNQFFLRLEWGFPLGDDSITEAGNSRFHFSVDFQEKLPDEIERIKKERKERQLKKKEEKERRMQEENSKAS